MTEYLYAVFYHLPSSSFAYDYNSEEEALARANNIVLPEESGEEIEDICIYKIDVVQVEKQYNKSINSLDIYDLAHDSELIHYFKMQDGKMIKQPIPKKE